jgi:hypothetical protein
LAPQLKRISLDGAMITREQLEEMFASIRAKGHWSIDDECRWDYFFVDTDRDKLIQAPDRLESEGFEVVGLLDPNPDDDDQDTVYLQVQRVERHTVDSLLALNTKVYVFAEAQGLSSYDGMDVSPLDRAV